LSFIAFAALILVAGCGGEVSVQAERQTTTGIFSDERIVVLLSYYRLEGNKVEDISAVEERFERCIRTEMHGVNDDLRFLPPADFRKLVSADATAALTACMADDGTQSPESLLRLLGEPGTATPLAEAKVRYVVLLEATYSTSRARVQGGQGGVVATWQQYSNLTTTILDLKHARIVGSIKSKSQGEEGHGIFFIIPFYFASMAESGACAAVGKELARFISGTSTP
jgi:hypothetical protein